MKRMDLGHSQFPDDEDRDGSWNTGSFTKIYMPVAMMHNKSIQFVVAEGNTYFNFNMIYHNGMNFTITVGLLAVQPTDTVAITRIFYWVDSNHKRDEMKGVEVWRKSSKSAAKWSDMNCSDERWNGVAGNLNGVKPNERLVKCGLVKFKWGEVKCRQV
jgi:hypothetical protein